MVPNCILGFQNVDYICRKQKELEDGLESVTKKDGLISKLKQDIELGIKAREGVQAVRDGARMVRDHRLENTKADLKRELD